MLKTLQLCGFKSFADRTEFHFAQGITGVVGPNGSGKSNIVDAVKWVLGEQSAKSLRGGEMTDVIFNGSASRRSLGMAEVTMIFDNASRSLATDAAEVQITRRVYRSGEGEYLINGEVCRLKDIKQLFLGSGAGTDAYCIIEQGRVDVLLQASTKERRTIFEEAAGISRFKAKKVETLRKLERVDQNVQRLKDIIDEVEKQLRSVNAQASRAQSYLKYTARMRELRLGLGLQEYGQLAGQLAAETAVLDGLRADLEQHHEQASEWEGELARREEALSQVEEAARAREALLAQARQQIASEEKTLGHEGSLTADLESELAQTRARLVGLHGHVAALAESAGRVAGEVGEAENQADERRRAVQSIEDELQRVVLRVGLLHKQLEADKKAHFERMRHVAALENDAKEFKWRLDSLNRDRDRHRRRGEQAAESLASVDLALQEMARDDEALQARLAGSRQRLADQRQERERLRQAGDEAANVVSDLRARRSGLASRVEVLEGLERSHEGLDTGTREMLDLAAEPGDGPWRAVIGMVADLLTVRHEYAPLIDLALGDRAQRFVVRDAARLHEALRQRSQPFAGRVSFLTLRPSGGDAPACDVQPPALDGVVAAAESLVTCDSAELSDLPRQLLGRTLIVRDLDAARAVAAEASCFRCVTLRGEVLDVDGTLTVGTHHAEMGILSRKSELRELRGRAADLDRHIVTAERDLAQLRERVAALDAQAEALRQEVDVLAEQAANLRSRVGQYRQQREGLHEEVVLTQNEIAQLEADLGKLQASWELARGQAARAEAEVQHLGQRIEAGDRELREREAGREDIQLRCTEAKVALGKVEERLSSLRGRHQQTTADLGQRRREQAEDDGRLAATRARLVESQRAMLDASAALARWYLEKEDAERRLAALNEEREAHRAARQRLQTQSQAARGEWKEKQEQAHARDLEVNNLRNRRDTLVARLHEDYQVDLAELYEKARASPSGPDGPTDPGQANEEIADLQSKLKRLGSVNMDALEQLEQLEARAGALQAQYDDLASAKRSLEEIIAKINEDSRKLFTETFAAIRTNFQELFRKLFGGGMADIVLEDEADVLESGIEIVARPPGKELRSISLMSGGEKTMTAVALLLAIFRSRPSPFCILDEVDAALDEANIGRYASVLREFLDRSHFIIVTHSKRTMATCDVLYGVTMQESGISKRVAVRFEDWPDDPSVPVANGR